MVGLGNGFNVRPAVGFDVETYVIDGVVVVVVGTSLGFELS